MEQCLQKAVHQLGQIDTDEQTTSGRVIHIQKGAVLENQRRIRVVDGFDTPQERTIAEAISDKGAELAITDALSIQFGVTDIVEGGTFDEQKSTLRYAAAKSDTPTLVKEASPSAPLQVRGSNSLLLKIDQLRLMAEEMEVTQGRAIHVEQGGSLDQKRRIRVVDDFDTTYQNPIAQVVCTQSVANAIACAMQVVYGAERIVEGGRFLEEKVGLRYQIPKSSETRYSDNIVSEDATPSRGRG